VKKTNIFSLVVVLIILFASGLLFAQENTVDLRLEGKSDAVTYMNFIYAHNFGDTPWMAEVFHCRLPVEGADDYYETTFGVGYNSLSVGDIAVYGLLHYSKAIDDNYAQPGLFALDVDGNWTGSLWAVYYVPLGDIGIEQILVDPVEIQRTVYGSLSFGVSGYLWKPQGGEWLTRVGPKLSYLNKWGTSEIRLANENNGGGWQVQLRHVVLW